MRALVLFAIVLLNVSGARAESVGAAPVQGIHAIATVTGGPTPFQIEFFSAEGFFRFERSVTGQPFFIAELVTDSASLIDPETGSRAPLDEQVAYFIALHDFPGVRNDYRNLETERARSLPESGKDYVDAIDPFGHDGRLYVDAEGRIEGYAFHDPRRPHESAPRVTFLEYTQLGETKVPSRVRVDDPNGIFNIEFTLIEEVDMDHSTGSASEGSRVAPTVFAPDRLGLIAEDRLSDFAQQAVATERAFAQQATDEGMKAAFGNYLFPDAAVFSPAPFEAATLVGSLDDDPANQPLLEWAPQRIVLSQAGDLAFLTGPWKMTLPGGSEPTVFGQYLSIWQRRGDASWRVLADIGTQQTEFTALPSTAFGVQLEVLTPRIMMIPDPMKLGRAVEAELEAKAFDVGVGKALMNYAAPAIHVMREGSPARSGKSALAEASADDVAYDVEVIGAAASNSNDFVAAWGLMKFHGETPSTSSFLRVWQSEREKWEIIADVQLPHPPAADER